MNFDTLIKRENTHSMKWDMMQKNYDVAPKDGIAMWVADMDFAPPQAVTDAIKTMVENQVFGYYGADQSYKDAICGWMSRRHNWKIDPDSIFTVHGLVNGVALALQAFSEPGDDIIIFTPVYHQFSNIIKANDRVVHTSELLNINGRYELDLTGLEASLTGNESMMVFCSPHNPGGRVWTEGELNSVVDFCIKHDLILVSDEIHHDIVFGGAKHIAMPLINSSANDRIIMLTAATKSFNIAGCLTGNVIIENLALRNKFAKVAKAGAIGGHAFGQNMCEAAYAHGDQWMDECTTYLEENSKIFDRAINQIAGANSMKLEATYLAWVDFSGTGLSKEEIIDRVQNIAKIAASHGHQFGENGKLFMRFNIACPKSLVIDAAERLQAAFSDV